MKKILTFVLSGCCTFFISSCSRLNDAENIEVEVWYKASPLDCLTFERHQQLWSIKQLAFFMSHVTLSDANTVHQPKLSSTPWQSNDVVLVQPNLGDCTAQSPGEDKAMPVNSAISPALKTNDRLQFLLPVDLETSEQLSFTLGVPFELNHQNPLLQPSPLNLPSMFWSWRSGHKFFRLDIQSPDKNWVFHLGSVGCTAASIMRSPQIECVEPNRVNFNLDKKHDGAKLVMHLDRLIANTSIQNNDSCLFHADQQICTVLMSNLKNKNVFEWH